MTVGRIKSFPYPERIDSIESAESYLKSLYRSLTEEQVEKLTDFENMDIDSLEVSALAISTSLNPTADATVDLGAVGVSPIPDYRFRHLYLSGNLSDETNTLTVANAKDAYDKRVDTWGNGLEYSAQTAAVDYNTTNLKITSTELDTIQGISSAASPTFAGLTLTGFSGVLKASAGVVAGSADHVDLGNLQGGTSAQYYHLNSSEHTELTGWLDNITLGSSGALTLVSGTSITEFSTDGTLGDNSDDAVPTEAAVKTYADALVTAQDLDFGGDTGTGAIDLDSQTLTIAGTDPIDTAAANQTLTISHKTTDGYKHIPTTGASAQILQYSSAGTAKWITLSSDVTIADNGAMTVANDSHTHGTQYQPLDAELTAIAGLTSAADKYIRYTGSGSADLRTYANVLSDIGGAAASHAMSTHSDEDTYNISTSGTLGAGNATLGTIGCGAITSGTVASSFITGTTIGNLTLADGSITDSGGAIDFGNENLSTTGTVAVGASAGAFPAANVTIHMAKTTTEGMQYITTDATDMAVSLWLGHDYNGTPHWGGIGLDTDDKLKLSTTGSWSTAGLTLSGNNVVIVGTLSVGTTTIPGAGDTIRFSGTAGGGNEGISYTDSGSGLRYGLLFESTNKVALCNRAANGVVQIRANTATAGGGGETTVAIFEDNKVKLPAIATTDAGDYDLRYDAADGIVYDTSDKRQKKSIRSLNYGLIEILQLEPKKYDYYIGENDYESVKTGTILPDGEKETKLKKKGIKITNKLVESFGLIAQEVYDVIPEAVYKPEDEKVAFWGLRYKKLIPVLVNAIKELNARIKVLEAE